jgi:hypothetical protein
VKASGGLGSIINLASYAKMRGASHAKKRTPTAHNPRATNTPEALFAHMVAGAKTEDQQLRELEAAARKEVRFPADAFVVDEPVMACAITYAGHPRAGLSLVCARGNRTFTVGLADVFFPAGSEGARFVSRYRAWLGLGEISAHDAGMGAGPRTRHKVATGDITIGEPVELIVLACKSNALRCRLLGSVRELTLRTAVRDEVPGSIITVKPTKQWTHARHAYLAGKVVAMRSDVQALGLVPLVLHDLGEWDPEEEYWGEEGEPIDDWAKPIIARGKRPMFEMEQVVPGRSSDDFDADPILNASDLHAAGDPAGAREILMNVLAQDLRCLDAHAHLGNLVFFHRPDEAECHYEMGVSIGALSLGKSFDGVLPWGHIDNRPFLRCLHGLGLCAWRLGDQRAASAIFRKMLWLNPSDNQGARFNLAALEAGRTWEEMEASER